MCHPQPRHLNQLAQRLSLVEQMLRTALWVEKCGAVRVDAERVIDRGKQVFVMHGSRRDGAAGPIGRADDLTMTQASSGKQRGADLRPVMPAAALGINARRAPELAP